MGVFALSCSGRSGLRHEFTTVKNSAHIFWDKLLEVGVGYVLQR